MWGSLILLTLVAPIRIEFKVLLLIGYIILSYRLINMTNNIFHKCFDFKHNFNDLPLHNTIFLVSYPVTSLEYMIPNLIPKPLCIITSNRAEYLLKLVYEPREYLVYNDLQKNNYEYIYKEIEKRLIDTSMYVFVEDISSRPHDFGVGNMRKGMFYIARDLGITITPIAVDAIVIKNGTVQDQRFEIRVGKTSYVDDPISSMTDVKEFLSQSKRDFQFLK
jgi:hypothetical protein